MSSGSLGLGPWAIYLGWAQAPSPEIGIQKELSKCLLIRRMKSIIVQCLCITVDSCWIIRVSCISCSAWPHPRSWHGLCFQSVVISQALPQPLVSLGGPVPLLWLLGLLCLERSFSLGIKTENSRRFSGNVSKTKLSFQVPIFSH